MKTYGKWLIWFFLIISFNKLIAQKTFLENYRMTAILPAEWHLKYESGMYAAMSPDETSVIIIFRYDNITLDYYKKNLAVGIDLGDGFFVRMREQFISLNSDCLYFDAVLQNSNGSSNAWGGLKQFNGGGIIGLLAVSGSQLEDTKNKMTKMLLSCEEVLSSDNVGSSINTELKSSWFELLTQRKLEGNFSSYEGGYYSSSRYNFCRNGTYSYYYEFVTTYSPSVTNKYGTWQLLVEGNQVYLILSQNNGEVSNFKLGANDKVIYIGNSKYLISDYYTDCN